MDISQYQGLIRGVVGNMTGHTLSRHDIADIVQEVNLRILDENRRPDYDPARGEVTAWIACIARSMSIDALRRHSRRLPVSGPLEQRNEDGETFLHDAEDVAEDALEMLMREEKRQRVENAIKRLHPDDQHFLIICVRDDFSYEEYAARLGVKPVALRVRKMRLAERLRAAIAQDQD